MKIGVFLKQVPDTASRIRVKGDGSGIETEGLKFVINPYDEFAIEQALKVKEAVAGSEVVIVSLGPARVVEAIRTALAMGADRGIHVDSGTRDLDGFQMSLSLSAVAKTEAFDLIFCGKKAVDGDHAQTVSFLAEFLNWHQVSPITQFVLNADQKGALVTRPMGGGIEEKLSVPFPCVLGCDKGLNNPRYASLPGIMKAKSKPVQTLKLEELLGGETARVKITKYLAPAERKAGRIIQGASVEAKVLELVRLLHEEAKVI